MLLQRIDTFIAVLPPVEDVHVVDEDGPKVNTLIEALVASGLLMIALILAVVVTYYIRKQRYVRVITNK